MTAAKATTLAAIDLERDPNVLWPLHKMGDDFDVMKAAANRIYELTEGGKNR